MVPQAVIDRIRLAEWVGGPVWDAYIAPMGHPEIVTLPDPRHNLEDDYALLMVVLDKWGRKSKELDLFCEALEKNAVWHDAGVGYRTGNYGLAVLDVLNKLETRNG